MASKLQNICALSDEVGKSLSDYEKWTAFLKSAAWQYKYSFQDQLFIYAQRPDATACASIDVWNKRLKSWINRGAKGIALLREGDRGQYLDYVFDISDTHSLDNTRVRLWQYNSRFDEAIIETLENSFGELKSKSSITDAVISAAQNAVEDSKADYLSELKYAKENSFLDGLDELNIDVEFQQTAEISIAYMVLQRLGINADEVFEREDFPHIMNFNTIPALSVLGNAVSSISEETLRNISETIRAEVREEINARKNFAEEENAVYNEVKEKDAPTINNERTDNYDRDNIHGSKRVQNPELDSTADRSTDRQIRTDAEEIPQKSQTEPIHELDDNRQDNGASAGSTDISDRADTEDSPEIGTDRGRERGTESERPDDVGRTDEQPTPFSGRSRTAGGSLQLSLFDLIPTEDQQRETVQRAAHEIFGAAFSMPGQIIDEVLCDGTNDKESIIEICIEFSKDKAVESKAEFLKSLYKTDGKGFIFDGRKVSAWWNNEGIRISYGDTANINTVQLISWEDAAKRIDELLDLGRFAPKDTLLQMSKYEYNKVANRFIELNRNLNDEKYPELKSVVKEEWLDGVYPDKVERMAEHLKTSEGLDEIKTVTQKLCDMYAENNDIVYYRYNNPNIVNGMLADLYITRKTFSAQELTYTPPERFISNDEINQLFQRGSNISESKYTIYTFFDAHSDKAERIKFLKDHYGIGGSYTGLYNENHDAKGIVFSHGDLTKPYAKILLKWNEVEKRIDRLIKSRNYLNEAEIRNIPNYEKEQVALSIKSAYAYDTTENMVKPYPNDSEYTNATRIITEKLSDTRQTAVMLSDLKELFAETPSDARSYPYREKAVQDLEQYANGEYNLFPHIDRIEEVKEETVPEQLAQMSDEEKQELVGSVEMKLDYSRNDLLTDDDMALYRALIEERFEKENQPQQPFSEYLAELHKDDNGSKTVAVIPLDDFYEIYGDDAQKAADVLDITVISKEIDGIRYPMCGFPKHTLDEYANKLLYAGYDVVIADENRNSHRLLSADKIIPEQAQQTKNEPKQAEIPQTSEPEENAESLVGTELTIDDRKFVVDSVNTDFNKVSLKDITFQNSTGFPIFRSESIDFVKSIIAEQAKPQLTAEFQKAKPQRVQNTVIYPEIPLSERRNFQITNDELGYGTPKEKFKRNVDAVNLLHNLEFEHRLATPEEQEILSQYVGWGGLADAFDESKENWSEEFKELYTTLSPDEYEQARASTLTAHFTPPVVIKAMYKALSNMGFTQGNILEPSCGIGNFMGLMPESMSGSKMYGVEIDSITGRIAQQLYQKNSVAIQGYENSELPDSFFDVAIGNVPFGDFKLLDKKYNKHNFLIHDYFFAKTLDKVRPGGVIAFITSSGTMDKRNSKVRKYIAQRADLIGAIRLPNNTFKKNAGTEVTADILFLQKRERMTDIMPEWVEVGEFSEGQFVNRYFLDNPDMVMGELKEVSGPFGPTLTCEPNEDISLAEQLDGAIQNIHASITEYEFDDVSNDEEITIPADPNVRNFSFTVVDGDVYFRENSLMRKIELNATAENRVKGMIELRDCVRTLIECQTENYSDDEIKAQQAKLNTLYDNYTKKYGLINSRGNSLAFSEDSSYFLLCSLEVLDEYGELERKADMFTKRTIRAKHEVTKVDTADEALAVSLAEKAKIDIAFMEKLSGKTEQQLYEDLHGVIFLNPEHEISPEYEPKYLTADEYLSGNVREKLSQAEQFSKDSSEYRVNAEYLEKVQPKDLTPGEISVKLGTTWIPEKYIEEFVFELLSPNYYAQSKIEVKYSNLTGEWNIQGKSADKGVKATNTYGTSRISAYKIIEDSLNLRDVRIFDYIQDENGNKVAKLNIKETTIAQQKQASIKQAFEDWIWKDPDRRDDLCKIYNVRFNSIRPREYDGSHITFNGINPEIALRKHQKDAVARIMYGGNSLLGHVVGAGKTWTMVAAAMESRRLGLCNKSLFVVPNHLTEQWASEFLQLYPAANILVATKKDFEMKNRKKFCGRIATGDYDAVIIGHSQFEKIPMSAERQKTILQNQLDEIINGIIEAKTENAERYTVKQMEKTKRGLEAKIKKLNDQERKDDVVTFEEIGVDRVFVDTVIVEDTKSKIEKVFVTLNEDGTISVLLPENLKIEHSNRITVTVLDKDGNGVKNISVTVKENIPETSETETENKVEAKIAVGVTDKDGKVIVPPASEGITDKDGKTDISETIPGKDTDGDGKEDTEETKTIYNILVEDTKGKIENAYIEIKDGKITVTLPDTHTLTTSNQTTVTVLDKVNKGVANVSVTVTDKNKTTATKSTDTNGKITVPVKSTGGGSSSGGGGGRGGSSGGSYISSNITNITVTDKNGKNVSVSKSTDKDGKITLTLPNGADLTGDNYYTIKATDSKGNAKADVSIILKDKKNNSANGTTDKNGMLILPASEHKAYIFGYEDGTFRPDNNMSRAEAAAIFARLISEQKGEKISGKSNFNDVSKNEWYSDYIGYLSKYGIIKGYSNSTFRPDDNVSRAEFVAMTVRFNALFNDVNKGSYTVKYTDVATNYWAYSDVAYAKHAGWLNGYADGTFKGDNAITRAEVVTVVNKATGRIADEGYINKNLSLLNKFTDLKNNLHWAFYAIAEASNTHLANTHDNSETWVK